MEKLKFTDFCANCRKSLLDVEKVLFVELELGRCFCAEECIKDYFEPRVAQMNEEFDKVHLGSDISKQSFSKYLHYRILTLQDPDEVWMHQTETGDKLYSYIANFKEGENSFTYVVICLALQGDPSFIFMSFPTRDENLIDEYRKGEDLKIEYEHHLSRSKAAQTDESSVGSIIDVEVDNSELDNRDKVLDSALECEELRESIQERMPGDISKEDYSKFNVFIEKTIDDPDEIWRFKNKENPGELCIFLSKFEVEGEQGQPLDFAMAVITRMNKNNELEIVYSCPTIDGALIQKFRRGINSLNKAFGIGWTSGMAA